MKPEPKGRSRQRLRKGDSVCLEREDGSWMKGVVVLVQKDGIDVVVDGTIREGEVLSVSQTVRDDARYTAAMEVVNAGAGQSRVRLIGDWKRVQMREFVRVAVIRVTVRVGNDEDGGRLIDLSAGGLRFESTARHSTGDVLDIQFSLPETGPVSVRGEVLRMAGRRNGDKGPYTYGVRFCGLDEATRVKIMTWVFGEQARRFRNGKKPDVKV